jgi:hydroxyacylglutathione hydrolase
MSIEVHTFVSGPLSTNAHVVLCSSESGSPAWIVDAPHSSADAILGFIEARQARPLALILTHSHWDHIGDAHKLSEALKLPVWAHRADTPNCLRPGADGVPCWMPMKAVGVDRQLEDGEQLTLGESQWRVLHTPGHTPGGICLWQPDQHLLITGDTLFKGTYGRTDLTTGHPQQMRQSLMRLIALPSQTLFFPGHGASSTLREETWLHDFELNPSE